MKFRVLGCSGAVMPGNETTSFLIGEDTLLDAGTVTSVLGIEEQELIKNVLLTHLHLDHIKDLFFLADNLIGRVTDSINIFSIQEVIDGLRIHILNKTIWPDFAALPSENRPVLRFIPLMTEEKVQVADVYVTPVRVNHTVDTVGYIIEDMDGSAIVYTGDTGPTEDIWRIAKEKDGLKAVFIEVSFPSDLDRLACVTGHLTPNTFASELKKLGREDIPVYVTHIKPQYREIIASEIEAIGDDRIHLLHGGEEFDF